MSMVSGDPPIQLKVESLVPRYDTDYSPIIYNVEKEENVDENDCMKDRMSHDYEDNLCLNSI